MSPSTRNTPNASHVALPNSPEEANVILQVANSDTPTALVSPSPNRNKYKYFVFELKNDHADEYIEGKQQADDFQKEYGTLITRFTGYTTKAAFTKAKKESQARCASFATAKLESRPTPSRNTHNASDDAKRILEKISSKNNVDSFKAYFHTNSRASEAIVAIRLTGIQGDDHWCWKPHSMCNILLEYFRLKPVQDEAIQQAFLQLQHLPLPDPDDPDGDRQKYAHITFSGSNREMDIPIFIAMTYLKIPIETLNSSQDETNWITLKLKNFFHEMKTAMLHPTFASVMTSINPSYAAKIFNRTRASNLYNFLQNAIVHIEKVDKLTNLLTRDCRDDVTNRLYLTRRHDGPKYCSPASESTDDEEQDQTN